MVRFTHLPISVIGFLAMGMLAVPNLRADDKPPVAQTPDDQKKLEAQIAELQKQLETMKQAAAQKAKPAEKPKLPAEYLDPFQWRSIGPANMGGRVTDIDVVLSRPSTFYIGTGTGGLHKTVNNGITFEAVFAEQPVSSIGSIAIDQKNPETVWVGTGENNPRNSVSYGQGVFKTTDGGKNWACMGLQETFQIGKVLIDPKDSNTVYVGALGRLYGNNEARGLFKTNDGGKTWNKILYVDAKTGVIDAYTDPQNPEVMVVAMWERKRDEFDRFSQSPPPVPDVYGPAVTHGAGGGLFRTTDGGKNWTKLNDPKLNNGLPTVKTGRIGLDYSRKTPGLIVAIIDTENVGKGVKKPTYLGVVTEDAKGKGGALVTAVTDGSPAAKGGMMKGDIVTKTGDEELTDYSQFLDSFLGKDPGETVDFTVKRGNKTETLKVTLSKREEKKDKEDPATLPIMGVNFKQEEEKLTIRNISENSAAAKAGLQANDVFLTIDGKKIEKQADYAQALTGKKPGDKVKVEFQRGDEKKTVEVTLAKNPAAVGENIREAGEDRPFGSTLGGQQANVARQQGKEGYQTGGVYISKDNGEKWTRINSLNPRPMYFSQIRIDPTDDKRLYVLGDLPQWVSTNGGTTFKAADTPGVHPDHHDLWIDPSNNQRMIAGTDGGFYMTYDHGKQWDHINTIALGQFYHVAVDNKMPYNVYGGLQDNGSWGGPSRTKGSGGPVNNDWAFVRGGDGFVCRIDTDDPDLIYSESQNGSIGRQNFRTGESGGIGTGPVKKGESLRYNWNTPFILSSHNPSIFYSGAQYVFRSINKGRGLEAISPMLTRTEVGSITALAESPLDPKVLWAGSDDGNVWVTQDGGTHWTNVYDNLKAAGLPGTYWVSTIEASRANSKTGRAYITFDGHRSDTEKPFIFTTEDYGKTWKKISDGLPQFGSSRCISEDIVNTDVLYAGTEFGAYVSIDRGERWVELGKGLPTVPVHAFAQPTTASELVVGTHGRSVWIIDISTIRQLKSKSLEAEVTLFDPAPAVRWVSTSLTGRSPYSSSARQFQGQNPSNGAAIDYLLTKEVKKATLAIKDVSGKTLRSFNDISTKAGMHRITWDLRGTAASGGGRQRSSSVATGMYLVELTVDEKIFKSTVTVELDPNAPKDLVATPDESDEHEEEEEEEHELPATSGRG